MTVVVVVVVVVAVLMYLSYVGRYVMYVCTVLYMECLSYLLRSGIDRYYPGPKN